MQLAAKGHERTCTDSSSGTYLAASSSAGRGWVHQNACKGKALPAGTIWLLRGRCNLMTCVNSLEHDVMSVHHPCMLEYLLGLPKRSQV